MLLTHLIVGYKFEGGHRGMQAWGPKSADMEATCADLKAQSQVDGQPWGDLCVYADNKLIRIVSPNEYLKTHPDAFQGYFDAYTKALFTEWTTQPQILQTASGNVTCIGAADGLSATCGGAVVSIPTAADVWGCASGPFDPNGPAAAYRAPLCAAFTRGALRGEPRKSVSDPNAPQNWYVTMLHKQVSNLYAFPVSSPKEQW